MRGVYLDDAKAGIARATRRRGKGSDNFPNAITRERLRHRIIFRERNSTRRHDIFPAAFTLRYGTGTFPGSPRARLPTGMR